MRILRDGCERLPSLLVLLKNVVLTWHVHIVDFMMGGVSAVSSCVGRGSEVACSRLPRIRPSPKRPLLPLSVSSSWCRTRTRWYVRALQSLSASLLIVTWHTDQAGSSGYPLQGHR